MKAMKTRRSFTLIELLVVIAIIAVLAGLLFPAISGARKQAKKAKARSQINALKIAIGQYKQTYGYLPVCQPNGGGDTLLGVTSTTATYADLVGDLSCTNGRSNPRNIKFLNVNVAGQFKDPWKQDFQVALDTSYDGKIENPSGTNLIYGLVTDPVFADVVIWSMGRDKSQNATDGNSVNKDNIYSIPTSWSDGVGHKVK